MTIKWTKEDVIARMEAVISSGDPTTSGGKAIMQKVTQTVGKGKR